VAGTGVTPTASKAADDGSSPGRVRPGRPGRQRSEAADQAIHAATLDVLGEDGFGGLTMAAVIARSGVSSATLYRRWPTKQDLVAAALASLHPAATEIDTGSLEGDIVAFVRDVSASMAVRPAGEALRQDVAVELSRNPDFRAAINEKFVVPRLVVLGHVLDRARERGELGRGEPGRRLTTEAAMSFVVGPLHHRVYVLGRPASAQFQRGVVVASLASLRALAPPD
jgi:AcrR family transcriptional regulator